LGANAVEIDLCVTSDGVIVLWHDANHSNLVTIIRELGKEPGMKYRPRVPNLGDALRRPVHQIPWDQFRANYGYTLATERLGTPHKAPYKIPTLEEIFDYTLKEPRLKMLFLDLKIPEDAQGMEKFAGSLDLLLKKFPVSDRVVLMSIDEKVLRKLGARLTKLNLAMCWDQEIVSLFPSAKSYSALRPALEQGYTWASIGRPRISFRGWKVYKQVLENDLNSIRQKHQQNKLISWTINDPTELRELVDLGVHGIMTDRVDLLKKMVNFDKLEQGF